MPVIFTNARQFVHPDGSNAYFAHSPRHGLIGVVGNHHQDRQASNAITKHTTWWAQRRTTPNDKPVAEKTLLPSRAAAVTWLMLELSPTTTTELTTDEEFQLRITALATEQGQDAAWRAAADATYMRLGHMLANRYSTHTPTTLWREIITMLSWFKATHPPKNGEI